MHKQIKLCCWGPMMTSARLLFLGRRLIFIEPLTELKRNVHMWSAFPQTVLVPITSVSSFDNSSFAFVLRMHMITPASKKFHHGAACNIISPVTLRRFKSFIPLRPCTIKPQCRFASRHSSPLCQAQAASVAEQSASSSPTKRPRSPGKKTRKKSSDTEDDAADTGEAGKRVVIVGGGWAGKSRLSSDLIV